MKVRTAKRYLRSYGFEVVETEQPPAGKRDVALVCIDLWHPRLKRMLSVGAQFKERAYEEAVRLGRMLVANAQAEAR